MRALTLALLVLLLSGCNWISRPPAALEPAVAQAYRDSAVPRAQPQLVALHSSASQLPTSTPRQATPVIPTPIVLTPMPEPTAAPAPPPRPPLLSGEAAPSLVGELAMQTYSIDFYRLPGGLGTETIQNMALAAEQAIISGTLKMGTGLAGRIAIRFEPPQTGPCAIRGLTLSSERTIRMFYEPEIDPNRVLAILAHEFIHQLQHDYYGTTDHLQSDVILLEGMAVWGSSPYFLAADGRPLYHVNAKQALNDGAIMSLTTSLEADCRTTTRVNIYDQWGSFTEYLLVTYGREKLDAVYRDSTGRPAGAANYQGVYGKSLEQLEADWVAWLAQTP